MEKVKGILAAAALTVASANLAQADAVKNIVLVHGAFADGSGWAGVYHLLKDDGYNVSIVQNTTVTLADDVANTNQVLDNQDGPAILVGHSYGGAVITEAGNNPKVKALVYIAAYVPDEGESLATLLAYPVPGAVAPPILPPQNGFLSLDRQKFPEFFAGDVDKKTARFMADSQVPFGVVALNSTITEPAWKNKPSFYLLTKDDKMIPPAAQKYMASRANASIQEIGSCHAVFVSHPRVVADLIEKAAKTAQ
jgi:pimeloyl-ACP methyl ester carboxylesterase